MLWREAMGPRRCFGNRRVVLGAVAALALLLALAVPGWTHLRAMGLLARLSDAKATGWVAGVGRHAIRETPFELRDDRGPVPARLYAPEGVDHPPGIVLAHGVHRLGIEEPRLKAFSRALASTGIAVLTPELRELADYRVDPRSIETIGLAVTELRARLEARRVGLVGMSFAGGLVLMAAADPRFAPSIGFVASVGGHDDLGRVLRFFVTNTIERPDGSVEALQAHTYGPMVLVYSHIEAFFPEADAGAAREALRYWLWEEFDTAKKHARKLGPESRARMEALFDHKLETVRPELLAEIDRQKPYFPSVSPAGRMGDVHAPIFLLHGAGDTVIPASETEWLAHDAPRAWLAQALVSKAISARGARRRAGLGRSTAPGALHRGDARRRALNVRPARRHSHGFLPTAVM